MARVTVQEVKDIMNLSSGVSTDTISAGITVANLLVSDKLTGSGHSTEMLKEIERWLSAHYVSINPAAATVESEKIGDASTKYAVGSSGDGLMATPYGKQAIALDYSGTLAGLGKRKAEVLALA